MQACELVGLGMGPLEPSTKSANSRFLLLTMARSDGRRDRPRARARRRTRRPARTIAMVAELNEIDLDQAHAGEPNYRRDRAHLAHITFPALAGAPRNAACCARFPASPAPQVPPTYASSPAEARPPRFLRGCEIPRSEAAPGHAPLALGVAARARSPTRTRARCPPVRSRVTPVAAPGSPPVSRGSLWIEFGKTKRSRRTLEVPAILRPYLLALAKGRAPDAQLISRTVSRRSGKKRDRYWLLYHVERLCVDAGVPVVCTQSLRGLHASVATDAGATSHVVASALGHSSPAVTHAHYIDGATARRARTRCVVGTVAPKAPLHMGRGRRHPRVGSSGQDAAEAGPARASEGSRSHPARSRGHRGASCSGTGRTHWFAAIGGNW
jgi:integrase